MTTNKNDDFLITEFRIGNAIVRIHDPYQAPEEKEQWTNRLKEATGRFMWEIVLQRRRKQKQ